MLPMEVAQLPSSEYDLLTRYWDDEPWGPWRDNLHFAMLIREVLRAGGYKAPKIDAFMLKNPNAKGAASAERSGKQNVMAFMKTVAVRKKRDKKKPKTQLGKAGRVKP